MKPLKIIFLIFLTAWLGVLIFHQLKPLPPGISMAGKFHPLTGAEFLTDLTSHQSDQSLHEQTIVRRMERIVDEAERFVLIDMFLFNAIHNRGQAYPAISAEFTARLLAKRQAAPAVEMVLITDPINSQYGADEPEHFKQLKTVGVRIVSTDLDRLPDSNPAYSAWWRLLGQWLSTDTKGWLPSPFAKDAPKMNLRAWLSLLNFKANHRKLVMNEREALVGSANLHDASAWHSNLALVVRGGILGDLLASERAIAALSGEMLPTWQTEEDKQTQPGLLQVRVLSEGKIRDGLLAALNRCSKGDRVDIALFYLSHRQVVKALLAAAQRGVAVRLLLDPNCEAFGHKKNGIPNRLVANELVKKSQGKIAVRWYATKGEQFHPKLALIRRGNETRLIAGSANFTRRNLDDLNLETDLELVGPSDSPVFMQAAELFERLWTNQNGRFSLDHAAFADKSFLRYHLYRFQEWSGMSTF